MKNALIQWFLEHKDDSPDKLAHNKTWLIIKDNLKKMGHYKNKTRGKHDAGYFKGK